jgi:hypothetical protein
VELNPKHLSDPVLRRTRTLWNAPSEDLLKAPAGHWKESDGASGVQSLHRHRIGLMLRLDCFDPRHGDAPRFSGWTSILVRWDVS